MTPVQPAPLTAAQRAGFWILFGTTLFQVVYPIVIAVSFDLHPVLAILILAFALLAFPMHLGLVWARALNVVLSFFVGGLFLFGRNVHLLIRNFLRSLQLADAAIHVIEFELA